VKKQKYYSKIADNIIQFIDFVPIHMTQMAKNNNNILVYNFFFFFFKKDSQMVGTNI
jgi:hypothetical protein